MAPHETAGELLRAGGFIQNRPNDGKPPTQRSEVFLGYDDDPNLENLIPGLCNHLPGSRQCDPTGNGLARARA